MPNLVNKVTGARLSVSESTAARLGSEWTPADAPAKAPKDPVDAKATARSRKPAVAE